MTTLTYSLSSSSPTYAANAAIRARLREVLDDGDGLVRTLTAGRISGNYWYPANASAGPARTLVKPRFDILPFSIRPTLPRMYANGNVIMYDYEIAFACEYALKHPAHDDATRDSVLAVAETDADAFRQALEWSGNLTATEAGVATGIVNGCLQFISYAPESADWTEKRLITRHVYEGKVFVTTATT